MYTVSSSRRLVGRFLGLGLPAAIGGVLAWSFLFPDEPHHTLSSQVGIMMCT
jgi:hypothetical protein